MHGNFTNEERRVVSFFIWDPELERKIDCEVKMIDGIGKMLNVATNDEQIIECNKALLLSQQRMLSFMSEIRRKQENLMKKDKTTIEPSKGTVSLSDIRFPLTWSRMKKAKTEQKRFAVFCLARIGCEIIDTQLKFIDKQSTEILFTDRLTFENVPVDFELVLEIYALNQSFSLSSSGKEFAERYSYFSNHGTPRTNRKTTKNSSNQNSKTNGDIKSRFVLIGRTSLNKNGTDRSARVRSLTLEQKFENPLMKLPIEPSFVSRFEATPSSSSRPSVFTGIVVKENIEYFAEIRSNFLRGEQIQRKKTSTPSSFAVPITAETIILSKNDSPSFTIFNRGSNHENFIVEDNFALTRWIRALQQQIVDIRAWNPNSEQIRERRYSHQTFKESIEDPSPKLKAKARSLDDLNTTESSTIEFRIHQDSFMTVEQIHEEFYRTRL